VVDLATKTDIAVFQKCPQCHENGIFIGKQEFKTVDGAEYEKIPQDFYCPNCNIKFNNQTKTKTELAPEFSAPYELIADLQHTLKRKFQIVGAFLVAPGIFAIVLSMATGLNLLYGLLGLILLSLGGYLMLG
jgi:rubredoxin